MQLAPIGLSVYGRLEHLKQSLQALSRNTLASDSELFVFSDAPQPGDEQKIAAVRNYVRNFKGFKRITLIERKTNSRVYNNRNGIKSLLDEFGKLIWLEEDIVTAPGFLQFLNDGLTFYQHDERVISLCGYAPPLTGLSQYEQDVFALQRFCAWGMATWKHKFDPFGFHYDEQDLDFIQSPALVNSDITLNGKDIASMVRRDALGEINALDVKIMYRQFKNKQLTLYPTHSMVQNIGHDGTGTHCGTTDRFHHQYLSSQKEGFRLIENIQPVEWIRLENQRFRDNRS